MLLCYYCTLLYRTLLSGYLGTKDLRLEEVIKKEVLQVGILFERLLDVAKKTTKNMRYTI